MLFITYVLLLISIFIYMTIWYLLSLLLKKNDIADVAWGLGFLFIAITSFVFNGVSLDRGFLVTLLVFIWAVRLSVHIYFRNKGKGEDFRYKQWREEWGRFFCIRSFFQVYMLQGVFMLVVAIPVVFINTFRGSAFNYLDLLGIIVWGMGFIFESIGDFQLLKFIKNNENKGKILQSGLWKYTRHPNYFGEITQWWGIGLISLSVPFGYLGLIGPFVISYLIIFVSGIPLLEKKLKNEPKFLDYMESTSILIPWFPKNHE